MRSLAPDKTIQRLGWKAARQSLKEARGITAPKPSGLPHFYWKHPSTYLRYAKMILYWIRSWIKWVPRTLKYWHTVWDHSKKIFVKEYMALAKNGVASREIFRQTKRRMPLTEDEIFEQGNRILRGENLP